MLLTVKERFSLFLTWILTWIDSRPLIESSDSPSVCVVTDLKTTDPTLSKHTDHYSSRPDHTHTEDSHCDDDPGSVGWLEADAWVCVFFLLPRFFFSFHFFPSLVAVCAGWFSLWNLLLVVPSRNVATYWRCSIPFTGWRHWLCPSSCLDSPPITSSANHKL